MRAFDLFIPTRKRPSNVHRLLKSIAETASHPERLTTWLYIDDDDTETQEAVPSFRVECPTIRLQCCCGPRLTLANTYNVLYTHSGASLMFSGADDIVFKTPGWDEMVEAEYDATPDDILLVYGDDCLQREKLCTHPFISRRGAEVAGYFYPVTDGVSLTDIWVYYLYRNIGRLKYCPDIVIEHLHWLRQKAPYDETYASQYEHNLPIVMSSLQQYADTLIRDSMRLRSQLLEPPCSVLTS